MELSWSYINIVPPAGIVFLGHYLKEKILNLYKILSVCE